MSDDEVLYTVNGEEHCDEDLALAELLSAEIIFANCRPYVHSWKDRGEEPDGRTVVLFVNCNDLFAWACADAEDLPLEEVPTLYKAWKAEGRWGVEKWCCRRRNQRPQPPVERQMREAGVWDAEMEALPPNTQDAEVQSAFRALKEDR